MIRVLPSWLLASTLIFLPVATDYSHARAETATVTTTPVNAALFGTGQDGTVVISSGIVYPTRDMYYANLTINGTGSYNPLNWRIYVSGVLDLSAAPAGAINATGNPSHNASGATGGAPSGSINAGYFSFQQGSNAAPTATTTSGTAANANIIHNTEGGNGGLGGTGGASGVNTGGVPLANTLTTSLQTQSFALLLATPIFYTNSGTADTYLASGASGVPGGAGAGDTVNVGGGGGGSSRGGGIIYISANIVNRGASTATGAIQAKGTVGGNGGNGSTNNAAGGGGAGGSGGGFIYIIANQLIGSVATNAIDVTAGNGGVGGAKQGSGTPGGGGTAGTGGNYQIVTLNPPTFTVSAFGTVPSAAPSGTTGGTAATVQGNL